MLIQLPVRGFTTDKSSRGPCWKGEDVLRLEKPVGVDVPLEGWDAVYGGCLTGTEILGVGLENILGVSGTGGNGTGGSTGATGGV